MSEVKETRADRRGTLLVTIERDRGTFAPPGETALAAGEQVTLCASSQQRWGWRRPWQAPHKVQKHQMTLEYK